MPSRMGWTVCWADWRPPPWPSETSDAGEWQTRRPNGRRGTAPSQLARLRSPRRGAREAALTGASRTRVHGTEDLSLVSGIQICRGAATLCGPPDSQTSEPSGGGGGVANGENANVSNACVCYSIFSFNQCFGAPLNLSWFPLFRAALQIRLQSAVGILRTN